MDPMTSLLSTVASQVLSNYFELVAQALKKIKFEVSPKGISIEFEEQTRGSIDERIAKIDQAKEYLMEGLKAIDDLRASADYNKKEAEIAIAQVAELEESKASLKEQLASIKIIAQTDIDTFRRVVQIPTPKDIQKERLIGFISGVFASLVAAAIWFLGTWFFQFFTKAN